MMPSPDKRRTNSRTRRTKAGHVINQGTDKTGQASDKRRTIRTHPPKGVSESDLSEPPELPLVGKRKKPPAPADPGRLAGWPRPLAPADLEGLLVTPATLEALRITPADLRAPADPEGWPAP
jgi:hypothetical protein